MRPISFWLAGLGFVQLGHVSVRLLGMGVPKSLQFRDAPLWTVLPLLASFGLHLWTARAVRERRAWGRPAAAALVAAWLLASYLAVNTGSADVGQAYPAYEREGKVVYQVEDSHLLTSVSESWRAVGWPSMLGHLHEFIARPTTAWRLPEFAFMAAWVGLGLWVLGTLVSPAAAPLVAAGPSDGRAVARRALAAFRADASATPASRALGFALAGHVAAQAILTVVELVGLSFLLMGRHT